jgi:hypothetical protein
LLCLLALPATEEMNRTSLSLNKACSGPRWRQRFLHLSSRDHGGQRRRPVVCLQPRPRARCAAWRHRGVDLRLSLLLAGRGGEEQWGIATDAGEGVN